MGSEDIEELLSIIVLNEITRIARGSVEKGALLRKNTASKLASSANGNAGAVEERRHFLEALQKIQTKIFELFRLQIIL